VADSAITTRQIALLRGLRAVRQFQTQPVPQAALDDILDVARWTGSSRNRQPWELVVVQNPATLQALAALEGYVKHLAGAPLSIALVMAGESEEEEIYDEGRLTERIMLAAAAHGLGSCIGWFAGDGVAGAKALLHVPSHRRLRTALSLGYPAPEAARRQPPTGPARKPLAEIVHVEQYND
jgi:nitroreductase